MQNGCLQVAYTDQVDCKMKTAKRCVDGMCEICKLEECKYKFVAPAMGLAQQGCVCVCVLGGRGCGGWAGAPRFKT